MTSGVTPRLGAQADWWEVSIKLRRENRALMKERDRLRAALLFYADPKNYEEGGLAKGGVPCKHGVIHDYDRGSRAAGALSTTDPAPETNDA